MSPDDCLPHERIEEVPAAGVTRRSHTFDCLPTWGLVATGLGVAMCFAEDVLWRLCVPIYGEHGLHRPFGDFAAARLLCGLTALAGAIVASRRNASRAVVATMLIGGALVLWQSLASDLGPSSGFGRWVDP